MPVRIYDISKKLGLENKQVLSKAKELGIAARVASSSLDTITAEYLEQQLILAHPNLATPPPSSVSPPAPPAPTEPIRVVTGEPQTESVQTQETATATAVLEPLEVPVTESLPLVEASAAAPVEEQSEAPSEIPVEPKAPQGPKVGDKVGFIQLPPKPGPKPAEKAVPVKLPSRPVEPRRTDFTKRGDIRSVRGAPIPPAGPAVHGARIPAQQKSQGGPSKAP